MFVRVIGFLSLMMMPLLADAGERAKTAHDFAFTSIEGDHLPLSDFEGQVLLIVNTASFCGFTRQYDDLQEVWQRFRDRDLVVLGVPSNDFGNQEPGTEAEIKKFCEVIFSIDFPMTEKVHVTGAGAHPFFQWAAATLGSDATPQWNFHKYLVGPDGRLVGWFPTRTKPTSAEVIEAIEAQLSAARGGGS
jgi:glutathione peroxidase